MKYTLLTALLISIGSCSIINAQDDINAPNKDPLTSVPISKTLVPQHREIVSYYENGKMKELVREHDLVTDKLKTMTSYYEDGKTKKSALKFKEDGTIVFAEDVEEDKTIMPNPNN